MAHSDFVQPTWSDDHSRQMESDRQSQSDQAHEDRLAGQAARETEEASMSSHHLPRWARRAFGVVFYAGAVVLGVLAWLANERADDKQLVFNSFFNSFDQRVTIVDSDHKIVQWSNGMETMFGWTAEEAEGHKVSFMIPEELCAMHDGAFDAAFGSFTKKDVAFDKDSAVVKCEAITKDGKRVPVRISVRLFSVPVDQWFWQKWLDYEPEYKWYATAAFDRPQDIEFYNGMKKGG